LPIFLSVILLPIFAKELPAEEARANAGNFISFYSQQSGYSWRLGDISEIKRSRYFVAIHATSHQ
jgi:hypothetical protein